MPEIPIVDTHVHLWDRAEYPLWWVESEPDSSIAAPRFSLPEYHQAIEGIDVVNMVYVEVDADPAYGLVEARWVSERAREDPRLAAIVAWAPVEHGHCVRSYLRDLVAISPLIVGVRRLLQGERDDFALQPAFIEGVQQLPEFGLSFDICIRHRQLPAAIELARRCPKVSFILDHLGKPNIKGGELDPWREQVSDLAALPNVVCKVSGAVTEADPEGWTVDDLRPYVEHVLAAFGEDRVMFGGDWPVVLLASSWRRWVAALDALTAELSSAARRKMWAENARRVYRFTA
jgi:L-fuconolactonase